MILFTKNERSVARLAKAYGTSPSVLRGVIRDRRGPVVCFALDSAVFLVALGAGAIVGLALGRWVAELQAARDVVTGSVWLPL